VNLGQVAYRYVAGRPLTTRPGVFPYLHPGDARWPGWRRQVLRIAGPVAAAAVQHAVSTYTHLAVLAGLGLAAWLRSWWRGRKFRRTYISPTVKAIRVPAGQVEVDLHVDRRLGSLVAKLATPLSPAEVWLREQYGRWLEPRWRRPAGRLAAARDALARRLAVPAAAVALWFRRPESRTGPRIELRISTPFVASEQRQMISAIVKAKIPVSDLAESWHQVGHEVTAVWVPRARPPAKVELNALEAVFPSLKEWEFFLGYGAAGTRVTVSLHDDSPHIALSAGTGAGKSILAQLIAIQVLRRGGNVLMLDVKGSHRWAIDMPGVDYCTRPEQMHNGLIRAAKLTDERNTDAFRMPEGWDPGPRLLVICEELNATIDQLADHWADIREKGQPKRSPAIRAFKHIACMGRSGKVNLLAIAQSLTARAIGGPEARENFGVRCLARYTVNAWKMLVPEAAMPRPNRHSGRWQVVVAGTATETQVCYLTQQEARRFAAGPDLAKVPDSGFDQHVPEGLGHHPGLVTLRQAIAEGLLVGNYEAVRKRVQRDPSSPLPARREGTTDLYVKTELTEWAGAR
jgi:Helicase HerA, central domain